MEYTEIALLLDGPFKGRVVRVEGPTFEDWISATKTVVYERIPGRVGLALFAQKGGEVFDFLPPGYAYVVRLPPWKLRKLTRDPAFAWELADSIVAGIREEFFGGI